MYVKVEPTGCCECKGLVQVRFCMYLEKGDYWYDYHHILVPVFPDPKAPLGGYPGEKVYAASYEDWSPIDENTIKILSRWLPLDEDDYQQWYDSLPKAWQNNPFHNHFIYIEPMTSDKEVMDIGEAFLNEAYIKWACDEKLNILNSPIEFPETSDKEAIGARLLSLKELVLERKL